MLPVFCGTVTGACKNHDQIPGFVVLKIIVNILLIIVMTVTTVMVYKGKEKV